MAVYWRASILQLVILTLICVFESALCDDSEYTSVGSDGAICPSATPVSSARSDIECAVACTGNSDCRSFGYATPFVAGSCLVSEMDNCTLMREGKTYRKMSLGNNCSFSGPMATGTTVMMMQRYVGDVNFSRLWSDYENGFGNCSNGDFWLGLRNIKTLLGSTSATWRVEMKLWTGESLFVEYTGFTVGDSSTNYRINYAAMGNSSASITAAGVVENNGQFCTMDRDNDIDSTSCSKAFNGNGGFWFTYCGGAFPTAVFPTSPNANHGYMIWYTGTSYISLREVRAYFIR